MFLLSIELPQPSNDISNSSQAPNWFNSSDMPVTDIDFNTTESHDDSTEDGQKNIESSSHSSIPVNEATSETDISENDVPIITTSSTTSTTSTSTTTTTTTTTTTPEPTTTTTTTTTPIPITTTTPLPTTTTTTQRTTVSTSSPVVIETTTPIFTTTTRPKPSSTPAPIVTTPSSKQTTTTTIRPNSITSRPKPVIVVSSTTFGPDVPIVQSYLKVLVNSTMEDICESRNELEEAIIKLFDSGSERYLIHTFGVT